MVVNDPAAASWDVCRAARVLIRLTQLQLAKAAGVGLNTVKRYEAGDEVRSAQARAIVAALVDAGAVFLEEGMLVAGVAVRKGVAIRHDAPGDG